MGLGLRMNHGEYNLPDADAERLDAQIVAERATMDACEASRAALETRAAVCGLEPELIRGLSRGLLQDLASAGADALDRPDLAERVQDELEGS